MTNSELIKILQTMPPNKEVRFHTCDTIIAVKEVDIKINGEMNNLIILIDDEWELDCYKNNFVSQE